METKIKAINFNISDQLEEFTNKKIEKLLRRYDVGSDISVTYHLVKPGVACNKSAGVGVNLPNLGLRYASKSADTFEEALDLAIEALEHQLEKSKDRK